MINLLQTDQVPTNRLLGTLPQEVISYCYQSVNVITLGLAQSDHIKRPPLYILNFLIKSYLGFGQTDHINRMITLSVITLSGFHSN